MKVNKCFVEAKGDSLDFRLESENPVLTFHDMWLHIKKVGVSGASKWVGITLLERNQSAINLRNYFRGTCRVLPNPEAVRDQQKYSNVVSGFAFADNAVRAVYINDELVWETGGNNRPEYIAVGRKIDLVMDGSVYDEKPDDEHHLCVCSGKIRRRLMRFGATLD